MLIEGGKGVVRGWVLLVPDGRYHAILSRFDVLEGFDPAQPDRPGYRRVVRRVRLADGRIQTVWVYVGDERLVNGRSLVEHGDWAAYNAEKKSQEPDWRRLITRFYGQHRLDSD